MRPIKEEKILQFEITRKEAMIMYELLENYPDELHDHEKELFEQLKQYLR